MRFVCVIVSCKLIIDVAHLGICFLEELVSESQKVVIVISNKSLSISLLYVICLPIFWRKASNCRCMF